MTILTPRVIVSPLHYRLYGGRRSRAPVVLTTAEYSGRLFFGGLALLLLVLGAGFLHIQQVTATAVSGVDVSVLERRVEALREEEMRLAYEVAERSALERVAERLPSLGLVPVGEVTYTSPLRGRTATAALPQGSVSP